MPGVPGVPGVPGYLVASVRARVILRASASHARASSRRSLRVARPLRRSFESALQCIKNKKRVSATTTKGVEALREQQSPGLTHAEPRGSLRDAAREKRKFRAFMTYSHLEL